MNNISTTAIKKIGPEFVEEFLAHAIVGHTYDFKGRITAIRKHAKYIFFDVSDHTGTIQIVIEKDKFKDYKRISTIPPGSYIEAKGKYFNTRMPPELDANSLKIISEATLPLSPNPWEINSLNPEFVNQIFTFTEFYLANPQRAAILKVKTNFVMALHNYFQKSKFTLVEPPILTDKILYESSKAVSAGVHGEKVWLSQCATFELEPLAMVFGKVYTISPAFRNEKGGSKRHLAEYTHAKAEALFVNIDDLMFLAGDSIYTAVKETIEMSKKELDLLGVKIDTDSLNPKNYASMTYDEAVKILQANGSKIVYGEGLARSDEIILTHHVGDKYLWVKFLPFASEGFPYKKLPESPHLSMTCDLIAPHGAGEMVGVAEKTTDIEEIIDNLIKKGKKKDIKKYWNYVLLRKYGLPPHGGIGAAPERIIYGLLGLNHIRLTKPFPRYPDRKINPSPREKLNPWKDPDLNRIIKKFKLNMS
jgi:asparaginyl-tRNA synthetase